MWIKAGKVFFLEEHREFIELEFLKVTATKLPPHDDFLDVVSDAWEKQEEVMGHKIKKKVEVNTLEWAEKQGFIPKFTFTPLKKRKGVR